MGVRLCGLDNRRRLILEFRFLVVVRGQVGEGEGERVVSFTIDGIVRVFSISEVGVFLG